MWSGSVLPEDGQGGIVNALSCWHVDAIVFDWTWRTLVMSGSVLPEDGLGGIVDAVLSLSCLGPCLRGVFVLYAHCPNALITSLMMLDNVVAGGDAWAGV